MNVVNRRQAHAPRIIVAALLAGCAPMPPTAPTVTVMPPPNKPFEAFVQDDQVCRNWAGASTRSRDANSQMAASTVTGAAIGAVAGALMDGSHGAGVGAGVGTLAGAGVGSEQGNMSAWSAQRSYDIAYQQCMYARGNVIPGYYPHPVQTVPPPPLR